MVLKKVTNQGKLKRDMEMDQTKSERKRKYFWRVQVL